MTNQQATAERLVPHISFNDWVAFANNAHDWPSVWTRFYHAAAKARDTSLITQEEYDFIMLVAL